MSLIGKTTDRLLLNRKTILLLYIVFSVTASTQMVLLGKKTFTEGGREYTHYNNYVIFKYSFYHLIQNKDLYVHYPEEQYDLFKYSPAFALFFGIFAFLPEYPGLLIWNLVNALMLYFAMFALPKINTRTKIFMLLIIIIELMTSLQNTQSNGLIAGLIIMAFVMLEKDKSFLATLCIISTVYIKLFGVVAIALFAFYPKKGKLILYSLFWSCVFLILPLVAVSFSQLKFLYSSWVHLLLNDHSVSDGVSVIGWLKSWFNLDLSKGLILIIGAVLFLVPFIRIKQYGNYLFRLLTLSSILIWIIIFNHRAESATFIIAMSGVVIWYFMQDRKTIDLALLILAIVFTTLSPTDIFPEVVRNHFIKPYALKAVPCILIWIRIYYDLLFSSMSTLKEN